MVKQRYVYGNTSDSSERARLRNFERCLDPHTHRRLEMARVASGWHCAEIGAGSGSIARWLAKRVSPAGRVLATDINPRFLGELVDRVDVRTHDILADDLEADAFDLVHCRALLMHLPDPRAALTTMIRALKPGGWLIAEEGDWGFRTFSGHPDAEWATEFLHALSRRAAEDGAVDHYFGRKLPGLVGSFDLDRFGADVITPVCSRSDDFMMMTRQTCEAFISARGGTPEDLARMTEVLNGASTRVVTVSFVAAWGRRPALIRARQRAGTVPT